MPKSASTNAEKADAYTREFKCLTRREQKLICTLCSTEISYGMRSQVIQNIKTETQEQPIQFSKNTPKMLFQHHQISETIIFLRHMKHARQTPSKI